MSKTILVKRGPYGTWHAYIAELREWLPTPYFGPFETVAQELRERNPGCTVEEQS